MLRVICDCGCSKELTDGEDAGSNPVVLQNVAGIEVEVRARAKGLNLRPECVRRIVRDGTVVEPKEQKVGLRRIK